MCELRVRSYSDLTALVLHTEGVVSVGYCKKNLFLTVKVMMLYNLFYLNAQQT